MTKTISQINEKIKKGKVVVVTAEEMIKIVKKYGIKKASEKVDVVTTGTFAPMCSSGMIINIGKTNPRIKLGGGECFLNGVPAYCGLAAGDIFLGATALPLSDPKNNPHPGKFKYGGAHVIHDFVAKKNIKLSAKAYGTDCYPAKKLEKFININEVKDAILFNVRNCSQNYNVAVNLGQKTLYTYMGVLLPKLGNASYCSAGQLSPLLNDPYYETIGIGTKIFLGGGIGYIVGPGTQHRPQVKRAKNGIPLEPAGTLSVRGNLKQMKPEWLEPVSLLGYGVSLRVGIGVPIPILNEKIAKFTAIKDEDILAPVVDYSQEYPYFKKTKKLGFVNYKELRSGKIKILGKEVSTFGLSNYQKAKEIALILKKWIKSKRFFLTECVERLPLSER